MGNSKPGKLAKFSRRAFLVGSAAIAGGVAFGAWQVMRDPSNPLAKPDQTGAMNPWIIIDQTGITLIAPRAEMGQGVRTTMAALIAEELDVDLAKIRIEHGPPAQAYFNGALMADRHYSGAAEAPLDGWSQTLSQALPKVLSLQVTGGSTTTIDAYTKLRIAGASARLALLEVAATRLNTGLDRLKTENGQVIAPDGSRIAYAELAGDAAQITPNANPPLKARADWKLLGKSQPRLDQPGKATGTAVFGMDIRQPGMLFASVKINPHLGAGLLSFDAGAAENMPGIEKIVEIDRGVAVIARNTWLAFQALEEIQFDWEDAPYPADNAGITAQLKAVFDTDANVTLREDGDALAALDTDSFIAEYQVPYLAHATMEVMNSTAIFTGDAMEIWSPNQSPVQARDAAAKAVGLKGTQVVLHTTLMGGGFGRRANIDFAPIAAQVAAAMPGRVVQTTWSREEDMRHDFYRPAAIARMQAKVTGGKITALHARMAAPSIMAQVMSAQVGLNISPADATLTEGAHDQPYAIENFKVAGYAADLAIPVGFWRSVGNSQNAFFFESFIDELAHSANLDPLEFRLNHIRPEHAVSAQVLENVRDLSGWSGETGAKIGRGVAFTYSFGSPVAEVIEVREEDGLIRITECWIAADLGVVLDPRNVEAQLTGGAIYGLSAAMHSAINFEDGQVVEGNFPEYDAMRMLNAPRFHVALSEHNRRIGGVGEIGTPPAAPALANALFDLTGKRARTLPLRDQFNFLT